MVNNLYFTNLFDKELKIIASELNITGEFTIEEILNNELFEVIDDTNMYQIIPLFNYNYMLSNNSNDIFDENCMYLEKNTTTIITIY